MQICESKYFDPVVGSDDFHSNVPWSIGSNDLEKPIEKGLAELLEVEVEPGQAGLHVVSVSKESPLCQLWPLGRCGSMQGLVESGDRIVAIDGILAKNLTDLARLVGGPRCCEITIFDHRTRLTVTWQFQVRSKLKVA
jgi:hypothetical protein